MSSVTNHATDLDAFMADYFAECEERMAVLRRDVVELEKCVGRATVDPGLLKEVFASFHSVKGLSGMVKVTEAERLAYEMEKYLQALRQEKEQLSAAAVHSLARGIKALDEVVAARRAESPPPDVADLLDELSKLVSRPRAGGAEPSSVASVGPPKTPPTNALPPEKERLLAAALAKGARAWQVVFVSSRAFAERGITVSVIRERLEKLGEVVDVVPRAKADGGIAFEFLLAGKDEAEAALASWAADGVTYAPYPSVGPVERGDSSPLSVLLTVHFLLHRQDFRALRLARPMRPGILRGDFQELRGAGLP
ncbi:MAG: Hpt domain-containing protein, partial [Pirellulales bacterium]